MSGQENTKGWYGLKAKKGAFVFYVCQASCKAEAKEIFGILAKGRFVFQLTWFNLIDLLGVSKPFGCLESDYAHGDLLFSRMGKAVCLWTYNRTRG